MKNLYNHFLCLDKSSQRILSANLYTKNKFISSQNSFSFKNNIKNLVDAYFEYKNLFLSKCSA